MRHHHRLTLRWLVVLALVAGCDTPWPDMSDQKKVTPHEQAPFFADGSGARPLVPGVVARPSDRVPGIPYTTGMPAGPARYPGIVPLDARAPFPITAEVIEEGRQQFNISCTACHGRLGNGEGMIVQRGFTRPPSFHTRRLNDAPDAHIYNVITSGYGAMFSYSDRVAPNDRWKIVAYVRALQASVRATADALPASDRAALAIGYDPNASKETKR